MVCPVGWVKSFLRVIWEDRGLIWRNLKKEIYRKITNGR